LLYVKKWAGYPILLAVELKTVIHLFLNMMTMNKNFKKTITEGRYWVNGYRVLGSNFKTYSLTIFNTGIMFCWGTITVMKECKVFPYVNFYKLV
jgi:hypothetical protein